MTSDWRLSKSRIRQCPDCGATLLKCPFCNGIPDLFVCAGRGHQVVCGCGASSNTGSVAQVIHTWNFVAGGMAEDTQ